MSLIQIRGLTKIYRMGESLVRALDGVDLDIAAGEFVAITGASGSGKSTMMHLLGCLDRPTAGSYTLRGVDVSNLSDRQLADIRNHEIGFVFQTFNLINRTAAIDNVGVPLFYARKGNTRGPAMEALKRVSLDHRAFHKPSELSGGERQRVAIARAIVTQPAFLLADEPTGNLDSKTGDQIMEIFHSLNAQGVTIVLVTHEPDIAAQARRIVQMRDGKIVADRSRDEWLREFSAGAKVPSIAFAGRSETVSEAREAGVGQVEALRDLPSPTSDVAPAKFERTVAPGANASIWCGLLAMGMIFGGLAATFVAMGIWISTLNPAERMAESTYRNPPDYVSITSIAFGVVCLVSVIPAILAIRRGSDALSRIRSSAGILVGANRAQAGRVLGWIPAILVGIGLAIKVIQWLSGAAGG